MKRNAKFINFKINIIYYIYFYTAAAKINEASIATKKGYNYLIEIKIFVVAPFFFFLFFKIESSWLDVVASKLLLLDFSASFKFFMSQYILINSKIELN